MMDRMFMILDGVGLGWDGRGWSGMEGWMDEPLGSLPKAMA